MPKNIRKIFILVLIIILFLTFVFVKTEKTKVNYDITKSPLVYNLNDNNEKTYFKYIVNYIKPKVLQNFVKYDTLILPEYNENATGYDVLDYITYKAYIEMFNRLFFDEEIDYTKFPVSKKFIKKFNTCPHKYFDLKGNKVNCHLNQEKNEIIVEDYKEDKSEEYEYMYYYYFNYKILDDGFIDDISLEYVK